jgi:hypothetical protein
VGYNNSWVEVQNNADRPLFAQAAFITNLDDITVSLNTPNVDIGHVKLQDADTELKANVVTVSPGIGGLVVSIANPVTAVNATLTNSISSFSLINPVTAVNATLTNPVSSFSLVNPVTAVTINNPVTAVTINNPVSSFSLVNPVTAVNATLTNPISSFSLVNPVTAVTINNPVSSFSLVNPVTAVTVSNPVTAFGMLKGGQLISDTVALPTRVLNDEALIAYARGAAVTESNVLNSFLVDKSGATSSLGTTPDTMTTVWGYNGLFPWNTFTGTGDKLYIKSVTNDPKIQGKTITIEGLDSNYNRISDTVTFNAVDTTTTVSTSINFYRINKIYLTGNNSNSLPHTYDITVRYGSANGTIVSQLDAPWGRGQNCLYTVPAGYEAFLLSMNGNSGKDDEITSSLWVRTFNGTWESKKSFKFISGLYDHNFRTPLRIPEKSDIEIRAFALVESSSIGTEFQLLVIPKA